MEARFHARRWPWIVVLGLVVAPHHGLSQQWSLEREPGHGQVIDRYLQLLERNPSSPHALDRLIQEYVSRGGIEALIETISARSLERPDDAGLAFVLARLRSRAGEYETALALTDRAIALGYDGMTAYALRGELHARLGALDQAARDFETAVETASVERDRVDLLRRLGDVYLLVGEPARALTAYRRITEVAPRDRYVRQELAQILYDAGFPDEALEALVEVAGWPDTDTRERADALRAVATLQTELGRYDEAIATWERVRDLTARQSWLRREAEEGIVRAYRGWGRLDVLLARLDERWSEGDNSRWVVATRARLLAELGRLEESVEAYRVAMGRYPDDRELLVERVGVLLALERSEEAQALLEARLEESPDDFETLLSLADLLVSEERAFDASHVLRTYQHRWWGSTSALWRLFDRFQQIGDREAANRVADRLMALDGDDLRPLVRLGEEAFRSGRGQDGLAIIDRLRTSDDPLVRLESVDLLRTWDLEDEAAHTLEQAHQDFPAAPRVALAWMRHVANDSPEVALDAARQVLLQADEWQAVAEAFELYRTVLREAGLSQLASPTVAALFDRDPRDFRLGRLLLMLQIDEGRGHQAARTLALLRAVTPTGAHPDEWVLSTLRRWPSADALPLLRSLGAADPAGAWRYELIGARLLIDAGRTADARSTLLALAERLADRPPALVDVAEGLLELPDAADQDAGLVLLSTVLDADPRTVRARLLLIDALRDRNRYDEAFQVAMAGFEVVREVDVAEALFDRLVPLVPPDMPPTQVAAALRERLSDGSTALTAWLDARLLDWGAIPKE